MTGSHATQSPSSHDPMNVDNAHATLHLVGPYAKPTGSAPPITAIDAVLIDAIRASAGPYVPAPLRSRPAMGHADATRRSIGDSGAGSDSPPASAELPWIDAFVDETSSSAITPDSDQWPLGEATSTIRSLVNEMSGPTEPTPSKPSETVGQTVDIDALESALQSPSQAPLPMWQDDDLMDIMPVRPTSGVQSGTEHWAEKARRESTTENHAEAAATLLEGVARRVRDGSLMVPGFHPSMSDAAALAAALSALLSTHE